MNDDLDGEERLPTLTGLSFLDGSAGDLAHEWDAFCMGGYLALPNRMMRSNLGLDAHSKLVLITLMSWTVKSNPGKPVRRRGKPIRLTHLMEWTGFSRSTIKRCLTRLEEAKFIAVDRQDGEPNEYQIHHDEIMNACYEF